MYVFYLCIHTHTFSLRLLVVLVCLPTISYAARITVSCIWIFWITEILNCVVTLACLSKNFTREIIYYYRLSLPQSFWPMYCVGRNNTEGNLEQGKFGGKWKKCVDSVLMVWRFQALLTGFIWCILDHILLDLLHREKRKVHFENFVLHCGSAPLSCSINKPVWNAVACAFPWPVWSAPTCLTLNVLSFFSSGISCMGLWN